MIYLKGKISPLGKYEIVHISKVDRIDKGTVIAAAGNDNPSLSDFEMMAEYDHTDKAGSLYGVKTFYPFADSNSYIYEVDKFSPTAFMSTRREKYSNQALFSHPSDFLGKHVVCQTDGEKTFTKGWCATLERTDVLDRNGQILITYRNKKRKIYVKK